MVFIILTIVHRRAAAFRPTPSLALAIAIVYDGTRGLAPRQVSANALHVAAAAGPAFVLVGEGREGRIINGGPAGSDELNC